MSCFQMACAPAQNGLRAQRKMVCAGWQNGLRRLAKWFAQLTKWFAPHFENNGRPWENDLRVDLRLVCALICAWFALDLRYRGGCACSAAQINLDLLRPSRSDKLAGFSRIMDKFHKPAGRSFSGRPRGRPERVPRASGERKVRAPQDAVVGNAHRPFPPRGGCG